MKKKFKMRFSYFLMAGLIGFVLHTIAFFMWTAEDLSFSQIKSSTSMDYFNKFVRIDYFLAFGALFLCLFGIGIFLGAKKDQLLYKIGGCTLSGIEFGLILICFIHLILVQVHRSELDEEEIRGMFDVLVSFKNGLLYASSLTIGFINFLFIRTSKKNNRPISKVVSYVGLCTNALFFIGLTIAFFGAIGTPSYEFLAKWFDKSNGSRFDTFSSVYGSMNGLTFGTVKRIIITMEQIKTGLNPNGYDHIIVGGVFAIIANVTYALSLIGNVAFVSGSIIESFDVDRDDDPMGL